MRTPLLFTVAAVLISAPLQAQLPIESAAAAGVALARHDGPRDGVIRPGRPVYDYLSRFDPQLDNGARYHLYRYFGRRGERISVHLSSSAFDTYLVIGTPGGRHGIERALVRDDDGGGNLDSFIRYTLPYDGEYVIRVNPVTGGHGRYVLELRSSDGGGGRDWFDDDRLDRRLFGRWELSGPGLRDTRPGTLAIGRSGRFLWRWEGRTTGGRLVPFSPRTGRERGWRYYLLEDGRDDFVIALGERGDLRIQRRSDGRVVARGRRDLDARFDADLDDGVELRIDES